MNTATVQLPSIPEEIIFFEILKRLPAKTLSRFKAVSKCWLSIITTSRRFIDSHFQHSKLNPIYLSGFFIKDATTRTTFLYDPQSQTSYKWDKYYPCFSTSPRGLICLYGPYPTIQILNPSTRESMEVNFPPRQLPATIYFFLGFDLVSKKHKLLCSSNGENYVFTLGENQKWRKIIATDGSSRNLTYIHPSNCSIDGIVYYLASRDRNDDELVLVAFDVGSERFLETISVPRKLVPVHIDKLFTATITVYRGRILLLIYDWHKHVMETWVLEDMEKQKWSPKRMIPPPPPSSLGPYKVGFVDGEELIYYSLRLDLNLEELKLCRYNLENCRWTKTRFPNLQLKLYGSVTSEVILFYYLDNLESIKSRTTLSILEKKMEEENMMEKKKTLSILENKMEKGEKMMKKEKRRRATINFLESLKSRFCFFDGGG